MIEPQHSTNVNVEPTVSDDPKLYDYIPDNAPHNVVINIGQAALLVSAPHALNDPHRMEVGDRRKGDYYLTCVGKMPGLMPLARVDMPRVEAVNKIRDIRVGNREPDWVAKQRRISEQAGGPQPLPFNVHNPLTDKSPLARAASQV